MSINEIGSKRMKKISIIILGSALLFLLSGCGQPGFSINNKTIVFVQGKAFQVPYRATYNTSRMTKEMAQKQRSLGINCKKGDIGWSSTALLKSGKINSDSAVISNYRAGKLGCAHPLNNQQYQYALNQQNQRAANARVNAQIQQQQSAQLSNTLNTINTNLAIQNAAMTPRIYNVNVHHYGY